MSVDPDAVASGGAHAANPDAVASGGAHAANPDAVASGGAHAANPVSDAWQQHRRHVLDVSFRMLGDLGEAEDVVQEAYTRLSRQPEGEVRDAGGWLVVVAGRICLDRLRARGRRPSEPRAELDAGPFAALGQGPADPADVITLDDHVDLAMHLVLERLTPAERTAFVLHDVFQYSFDEVGEIVGRSGPACRQLASRARRALKAESAAGRFVVEPAEQREVTERFIRACTTGDVDGLLAVLAPDVDGTGDVTAGGRPGRTTVAGAQRISRGVMAYLGPRQGPTLLSMPVGDRAGVVALQDGDVAAIILLSVGEGLVRHIDVFAGERAREAVRQALHARLDRLEQVVVDEVERRALGGVADQ
jgi:RNA polymerase sigma-70 factor (ECF subfamily)